MKSTHRTQREQMALFQDQTEAEGPIVPEALASEVVVTLAALLLNAAGVRIPQRTGGGDEPEDHA